MSRLSDSDKNQIVELYRQPGETTLTLAERYGVSNTTISRILKSTLSPEEYESLIQQKRFAGRGARSVATEDSPVQGSLLETPVQEPESEQTVAPEPPEPLRRLRKRSSAKATEPDLATEPVDVSPVAVVEEIFAETRRDSKLEDEDDDEDDLDDLEDLDDLDDDDDDDGQPVLPSIQLSSADFIRVLPIAEAAIPRTCYLVVDRSAELVARPLQEFAELGQIPSGEVQEKTLPVFDNHRVAKRFSNIRTQRVIKVPDSRVLQKAAPHLQAKGITRLLIDGQVYAL
jgi:transposase-like protein